ncbi:hypothetical protein [Solicola gregarius]|uniref:Uncharacterized protein n=1 Tax=Solicola gregarius TaxID=2908642 RepID=A0AA46TJH4_9ACTN|nr:hypothetical protein [Solicola gregarius]UYM05618.1 hypothetical protein L0C25_00595 [Solicola gregarius]
MNLDQSDPDGARNRLLVKLIGGLVIAGIVIGLVVGLLGTTVLRSMGLKEQPPPAATPRDHSTEIIDGGSDDETPSDEGEDEGDESETPDDESTDNASDDRPPAELRATPNPAEPGEEITLAGSFRKLHGGVLQVQRREGGTWTDFPVTANVNPNGTFSTYILTSRTGTAPFRLLHEPTGRTTPVVRITIG